MITNKMNKKSVFSLFKRSENEIGGSECIGGDTEIVREIGVKRERGEELR
jgi:hypothetical protein